MARVEKRCNACLRSDVVQYAIRLSTAELTTQEE